MVSPRCIALLLSFTLGFALAARDATACISGPGNGTAETGDCLNAPELSFGPRGDFIYFVSLLSIPALVYDGYAIGVGARRTSNAWNILGIVSGTVSLALTSLFVAEYGLEGGGSVLAVAGGVVGGGALVGGVVGLALDNVAEPQPTFGLVRCAPGRCSVGMPVPQVRHQSTSASIVLPLVDGRW